MARNSLSRWIRRSATPRKTRKIRSNSGVILKAERLEERAVPATFTVNYSGLGAPPPSAVTLQDAIKSANALFGTDTIIFAPGITQAEVKTGNLLPDITDGVIIDGGGVVTVICDGVNSADVVPGFNITAANVTIKNINISDPLVAAGYSVAAPEYGIKTTAAMGGLNLQNVVVTGFNGDGIDIVGSPNNFIGSGATTVVVENNNGSGIRITGAAATGNTVQFTTIDGNLGDGTLLAQRIGPESLRVAACAGRPKAGFLRRQQGIRP